MKLRIVNTKKFLLSICSIIFIILLTASMAGGCISERSNVGDTGDKVSERDQKESVQKPAIKEEIFVLASGSDGNVFYEENNFFKKYIIRLQRDVKEIKHNETATELNIILNEEDTLIMNSASFPDGNEGIFKKDKNKNTVSIKKMFPENNFVYIDAREPKNIIVLISKSSSPFKYKVALDPGHGGEDPGVHIGNLYEKDIVLKVVKYMVHDLRYNGCELMLSRETDVLNSLHSIADRVNSFEADVFLSVHVNSFTESKYSGIGSYYYDHGGVQTKESIRFSRILQKHVVKDDGWKDRNIFKSEFRVLRLSNVPSVLIECGFMTNPEDRERLQNEDVLKRLASNISNSILEFLTTK